MTLHAPSEGATVSRVSVPAFVCPIRSATVSWATGNDLFCIRGRLGKSLSIEDGDLVSFTFEQVGMTFRRQVKIIDDMSSDVLIHDLLGLELAESIGVNSAGTSVTLKGGGILRIPDQNMWAGMKMSLHRTGLSATLYVDGACRNNPHGPGGFGFHIIQNDTNEKLVLGSLYGGMNRSSNEMEYEALIEGLTWASRLDLTYLTMCGDSQLILKQVLGE